MTYHLKQISQDKDFESSFSSEGALKYLKELDGDHFAGVGLSGGVDSSLTAALLVQAGWKVEGLTLWLMSGKGSCCSDGLVDAAGICKQLDIPHHIIDSRETFQEEIVKQVLKGYQEGITPLPCSRCNRYVKFSEMLRWGKEKLGINRIATGHYARIRYAPDDSNLGYKDNSSNRHQLLRGIDRNKDQSYFLYDLTQDILGSIVFPLGELTKELTRQEANRIGLRTAKKAESQDLCLAEHYGSMKDFIDKNISTRQGDIILKGGSILGKHNGIEHFTIGQRKGLKVSWKEPLHVIELNKDLNQVIVAPRSEAGDSSCIVGEVNWVSIDPPLKEIEVEVQLRYRSHPILARLIPIKPTSSDINNKRPHRCEIYFKDDQFSITPGQASVFYNEDVLLGGGIIQKK